MSDDRAMWIDYGFSLAESLGKALRSEGLDHSPESVLRVFDRHRGDKMSKVKRDLIEKGVLSYFGTDGGTA